MKRFLLLNKDHSALFIAIISAYIYLCAYQYEQAYLQEFGVSSEYLTLDINTILKDAIHLLFLIVFLIFIYQLLLMPFRRLLDHWPYAEAIRIIVRLISGCILARLSLPIPNAFLWYSFPIVIGLLIILFLFSVIPLFNKKTRGVDTRHDNNNRNVPAKTFGGYEPYFWIIFLLCLPIFICQFLGQGEAYRQVSFDVIQDSVQYVVIRKYGEQVVCKDLEDDKKLGRKTIIYKLPIGKPLITTSTQLGAISITNTLLHDVPAPKPIGQHR